MSFAHPWLEETPWPTQLLSKQQLEAKIERISTMTNLGYLGTVRKDGSPVVSPVEFYTHHLTLYIFPQANSPKTKAIKRDPRISFAVANPMAGWTCVMGAQFFGTGTLLDPGTEEWELGMKVFKYPSSNFEMGRDFNRLPPGQLLRIDPERIVYTEHMLRKEGYAPRQIWHRDQDDVQAKQGRYAGT
ncbi:pyridoxamine 5'-phosphate oxidase family protein [Oceanicoccus sp. KOV_DT_Chl]|uniref:pyridoxamine 5'-phosphate oxidase family protein n=1 Tax=Oceanicoccus sp. KOV_DT_Chl TaxID=1904639 RepID=UPI000C7CD8F3|nr:pyridoxamine 5'-phosphate oxidase family protein [Oceanicoccus sp. KOV_DT_Chl]